MNTGDTATILKAVTHHWLVPILTFDQIFERKHVKSTFIPSGVCSTVSMTHEGECPVQKYGLKRSRGEKKQTLL